MKCAVAGCGGDAAEQWTCCLQCRLCPRHRAGWRDAPEKLRVELIRDSNARQVVAFIDWLRRTEAEERNGQ